MWVGMTGMRRQWLRGRHQGWKLIYYSRHSVWRKPTSQGALSETSATDTVELAIDRQPTRHQGKVPVQGGGSTARLCFGVSFFSLAKMISANRRNCSQKDAGGVA
jgi:hypothetical protein